MYLFASLTPSTKKYHRNTAMKRIFTSPILSLLALAASAEVITKTYEAEFASLNPGMPAAFQVGQGVDISLSFDDSALTTDFSYELSDFSFVVEEAGFDFSSSANSKLSRDLLSGDYSLSVAGNGSEFGGKTLLSINMDFVSASEGAVDFADCDLSSFYMTFYDPSSSTITAGSAIQMAGASLPPMLYGVDFELKLEGNLGSVDLDKLNYLCDFVFNFDSDIEGGELVLTFIDDNSFSFSDTTYMLSDDGFIYIYVPIPEPATYAAILGALALGLSLSLRRGKWR